MPPSLPPGIYHVRHTLPWLALGFLVAAACVVAWAVSR